MTAKSPKIGGESYTLPNIKNPLGGDSSDGGLTQEVRDYIDQKIREHQHNGVDASRTDLDAVQGLLETVTAVPSGRPSDAYDQIKIYKSGATYRLYWYEGSTNTWRYATGT